jgi:uncharacterized membrane protein YhaH (DUF805 family)
MMKRSPPALATWLLEHFASDYQRDSLTGDLIEQYHQGKSRFWYWQQVVTALVVAGAKVLRPTLVVSAVRVLLRLAAESVAVTGLVSLFYELRRVDAPGSFVRSALIVAVVLLALIASLGFRASIASEPRKRRHPAVKRLLAAFAAITLSVATLTWADTTTAGSPAGPDPAVCVEHR